MCDQSRPCSRDKRNLAFLFLDHLACDDSAQIYADSFNCEVDANASIAEQNTLNTRWTPGQRKKRIHKTFVNFYKFATQERH